jgi:uncharacterized protein YjiS (DUF1127 family)
MRQRLVQVLESDERDDVESEVLRRFWSRAKPLPVRPGIAPASTVVDMARWARERRERA